MAKDPVNLNHRTLIIYQEEGVPLAKHKTAFKGAIFVMRFS